MVGDGKALGLGHFMLAAFDVGIVKLFNPPAIQAHQVVMVLAFVEFID